MLNKSSDTPSQHPNDEQAALVAAVHTLIASGDRLVDCIELLRAANEWLTKENTDLKAQLAKLSAKPSHEWKFGDWVPTPGLGVVFVTGEHDRDGRRFVRDRSGECFHVRTETLTYISSLEYPV
ncbi:hypothetical protein [Acetobacter estunensis]|uniref:hypothetical protein n=1 Tax=Acetobacter estunensis TaxID=104097 RepID=UPI001C2D147A|nr:hypothetical protein [Acetobacter estunensis]MBV1835626.1 hypothetical protein [Acetobacter estunensis]MBV1836113.1 hypothetical protein [Acetobacter estunensis]